MKRCLIFLFITLAACSRPSDDATERNIDNEIRNRLRLAAQQRQAFPGMRTLNVVHNKVNDLILLSKDTENPKAAVVLGNNYFRHVFDSLGIDDHQRQDLSTEMNRKDVSLTFRSNELQVLNRLIYLNNPNAGILLKTVSE
jgi:hypothetical protein